MLKTKVFYIKRYCDFFETMTNISPSLASLSFVVLFQRLAVCLFVAIMKKDAIMLYDFREQLFSWGFLVITH